MIITDTHINYVREKINAPFGFKGSCVTELWQVICKIETEGEYGVGVGVQSVLWSDSAVYAAYSENEANLKMYAVSEFALKQLIGRNFVNPMQIIGDIYSEVSEFAQKNVGIFGCQLKGTFVKNALVTVDNALWQLYGRLNKTENLFSLIPKNFSSAFCFKHEVLCNIPLITYGTSEEVIKRLLDDGAILLKIKIGFNPDQDKNPDKMLAWDKKRLKQIHNIAKSYRTEYTNSNNILYYLDANGRYDSFDRVKRLLEFAEKIDALKNIVLFEEPFSEENKIDVKSLPVRFVADESVHSAEDVEERIKLGYRAIALKPIAKTFSETLKILEKAYAKNMFCFCADLTVNPIMVEFNKNIAARIQTLPEMKIGILESNGEQNYIEWKKMTEYHPMANSPFVRAKNGLYRLDESFFTFSGGIFKKSYYYDNIAMGKPI